nr:hypothetical protein [uncultured Rhodopila sp.]
MTAVPFDTLKLADRLQAGGFDAEQACTISSALADAAASSDIATKQDVGALKQDLSALETSVRRDLSALETTFKRDLVDLEQRVTIRFGGMLVAAVGIILAAFRYLPAH